MSKIDRLGILRSFLFIKIICHLAPWSVGVLTGFIIYAFYDDLVMSQRLGILILSAMIAGLFILANQFVIFPNLDKRIG